MNKARRAELNAAIDSIKALSEKASALQTEAETLAETIARLRDEEEEYKDNMPESMQSGDKYEMASAAVDSMQQAVEAVEALRDALEEFDADTAISSLDEACGVQ